MRELRSSKVILISRDTQGLGAGRASFFLRHAGLADMRQRGAPGSVIEWDRNVMGGLGE